MITSTRVIMSVRVAPSSRVHEATRATTESSPRWRYDLRPVNALPVLDLSLSVESRFLSWRTLKHMKQFARRRRLFSITSSIVFLSYFVAMLGPLTPGRAAGVVCVILWPPGMVVSLALLRFDVLVLVLRSYDYWFYTCVTTSTYLVLGVLLGDTRALALLVGWMSVQISMLADANIRGVKAWTIMNAAGFINCAATWAVTLFGVIGGARDFILLRYKAHELPARAFVTSGLLTVMAIAVRNVFRKRDVFRKRADRQIIKCVSYRVNLRFEEAQEVSRVLSAVLPLTPNASSCLECEKPLQFARTLDTIDARCTLLPKIMTAPSSLKSPSRYRTPVATACLGVVAILGSVASVFVDAYTPVYPRASIPIAQSVVLVLTAMYCSIFGLHYQRQLLRELLSSFDVVYLSIQLLIVHGSVCDFFAFRSNCVLAVFTSWLWCVWVVCLDAAPPVVRDKLGFRKNFAVAVVLALIGASFALTFLLFFSDDGAGKIQERVLWEALVFDHFVQLRLVPIFFSSFVTAFVLLLRVLWRLVANERDVLLLLDGAVVYENFLVTATKRNSRRWGSIRLARHQSPSAADITPNEVRVR